MRKKSRSQKNSSHKSKRAAARGKTASKSRKRSFSQSSDDVIQLILDDHQPLKELIVVMKDSERSLEDRAAAFRDFAPLLVAHSKPEEQVLYQYMKDDEELAEEGFEGVVEHGLADQMVEEAKRTNDPNLFGARIKVLAELVEHHIKEEEQNLLPDFRKRSESAMRSDLGKAFLAAKTEILSEGADDAPPERSLNEGESDQSRPLHA